MNKLKIKSIYTTEKDNISEDFYNPILKKTENYYRVSGYFSSHALVYFSKGLESLYHRKGKFKLLISQEISEKDYNLIKKGYENRENLRKGLNSYLADINTMSNETYTKFSNIAFLIQEGIMDVKVGFHKKGLFHSKFGIMSNNYESVYFSGSLNETQAGFISNYESILVIKSWDNKSNEEIIKDEIIKFNNLWNNESSNELIYVKEFNDVLKDEITFHSKGYLSIGASINSGQVKHRVSK